MAKSGYTLLEMTVTLTILGLVVSLVVVNYREPIANARREQAFERVDALDRRVRLWCKTNDSRARISVDLDRSIFAAETEDGKKLTIPEAKIPDGLKLKELRIMGENRFGRDTKISYTTEGKASCWAYSLTRSGGQEIWRLMIGATGQSLTVGSEDELNRLERMYENE